MAQKIINLLKGEGAVFLIFILIDLVFFWKYFLLGLIPIPADVVIGGYYPWLNQKWGFVVGVPVKNSLMSDVVSLLYPWRLTAIEYIKSGQLPLWDATSFLGTSLIGNFQAGIFNPFNLLFLLPFDFNRIWGFQVVLQPLLAMSCMYIMLKNWRIGKISAVFGALSYAFSAQLLVWIEYNVHSFILSVFPLFIYLIDKYIEKNKVYWLSGLSVIIAYIIFVGYPQHLYYFTFFGFLYFILRFLKKREIKSSILKSAFFFSFILIGLSLSAISLLPGIEALSFSVKNLDKAALVNSVLFLPIQNLITGLFPDFFGNPATNNYYGVGYYESLTFYTSLVAFPFVFISLGYWRERRILILVLFLLFGFLLALKNPFSELIQNLGFLGLKGSVSSRVLFIYGFAISSLGAIGLERFLSSEKTNKTYLRYLPLAGIFGAFLGIAITIFYIKSQPSDLVYIQTYISNLMITGKNSILPFGVIIVTSVLIFLSRFFQKKYILVSLLLVLILLDYYRFADKYLPFSNKDLIFPKTESAVFLQNQEKPFRIVIERAELYPANTWGVYGLENISGYNILLPKETADYISYLNMGKISEGYSRVMDINNISSRFLDITNVKYLVVLLRTKGVPDSQGEPPFNLDKVKYEKVFNEGPVAIYKNKDYLERFYTVSSIVEVSNPQKTYDMISQENFDYKSTAILEKGLNHGTIEKCNLTDLNYSPQNITLSADCPDNSFLVLSQLYYPGWHAVVNNSSPDIFKTNGILSGIYLPSGRSSINIYYLPDSFKYGALISLITGASLIIFFVMSLRVSSRKQK